MADYGLGHDDRAQQPQPVASMLGPRFLDWQTKQDVAESWEECHRHAVLIERILASNTNAYLSTHESTEPTESESILPQDGVLRDLFGQPIATDLFGDPLPTKKRRR